MNLEQRLTANLQTKAQKLKAENYGTVRRGIWNPLKDSSIHIIKIPEEKKEKIRKKQYMK